MLLNEYMQSNEYFEEIEKAVDENQKYKAEEKVYLDALNALQKEYGFDHKVYDSIDNAATLMMVAARELSYKKGFRDGVLLVTDCISARQNNTDKGMDYNQALKRADYKQAWDLKANAHNQLIDLLMDHGVNSKEAKEAVEKYGEGVEAYALISDRLGIPQAI